MQSSNKEMEPADYWTEILGPKKGVFSLNLKEVWRYRDLLVLFVKRDFTAKYKQTILGPIWHFVQPILSTLMSFLLFNVIAKISTKGADPLLFQMSGIVLWNYFSLTLTTCASVFISNASIFGKVYFPRLIMPLSIVVSNIIQFGIQLILLISTCTLFYFQGKTVYFGWQWLTIPLYVFLMAGIGLSLGIIISSLTTKYKDLSILITFGIQLLMYASAVNYPMEELANKNATLYNIVRWNPLVGVVEGFRNAVLGMPIHFEQLVYPLVFMVITLLGGILLFNRVERTFMDTV